MADEYSTVERSVISPLAEESLLLASSQSDSLTVVVGERGHILYSIDEKLWTQAIVNTKATLTNVFMLNETTGWAVGHDAVILKTTDGAKNWEIVFSDAGEEAPLLDIYFKDELNGIAVGAYGLMYKSSDSGLSWQKSQLTLSEFSNSTENSSAPEFTEVYDLHLNALVHDGGNRYFIAVEAGHILRSDDNGATWYDLPSPYAGSFFGMVSISESELMVYGLRGHLYHTLDAGENWTQIETHTNELLTDAKLLSNNTIVITGLSGTLLISNDKGKTFSIIKLKERNGLSSIQETKKGRLILTSDTGVKVFSSDIIRVE